MRSKHFRNFKDIIILSFECKGSLNAYFLISKWENNNKMALFLYGTIFRGNADGSVSEGIFFEEEDPS